MSVPTCDHLKEDGVYCGSPALNGRKYCYFHLNLRGRRLKSARARRRGDNPTLNLPFPEDMHAVQVSLAEILWALAEHRIDHKSAGLMLYTLQQASTNLNQTPRWQGQREAVPVVVPSAPSTFPISRSASICRRTSIWMPSGNPRLSPNPRVPHPYRPVVAIGWEPTHLLRVGTLPIALRFPKMRNRIGT